MPDPEQLPHLLKLIDDDSEGVRRAVAKALSSFGPTLEQALTQLTEPPDEAQMQLIRELLAAHKDELPVSESVETATTEALFTPGQLVRHRRYDYRGVVVAFDLTCQAEDDWYLGNSTQPERSQPWYHVLVHGSHQVTYAAQTSLDEDDSGEQVFHPLVPHLFSSFDGGQYVRNDEPWPDS